MAESTGGNGGGCLLVFLMVLVLIMVCGDGCNGRRTVDAAYEAGYAKGYYEGQAAVHKEIREENAKAWKDNP